jgi:hypothetical protein
VEVIRGSSGARLKATKDGASKLVLVRASSDRWIGWMRTQDELGGALLTQE